MRKFRLTEKRLIGAVHFPPLLGYPNSPGLDVAFKNALFDALQFQRGGFDAIIFENNYDLPHTEKIPSYNVSAMTALIGMIAPQLRIPYGVSVLWNDYAAALGIAVATAASFIRVPVFVDRVKTSYGTITGTPRDVIAVRKKIGATQVALLTDIHVKHATLLSKKTLRQSAIAAKRAGADGIIITGQWTGDAPILANLETARSVGDIPIIAGSGVDHTNVRSIFAIAQGAIVSTSLKTGTAKKTLVNRKGWTERISLAKVKAMVKKANA